MKYAVIVKQTCRDSPDPLCGFSVYGPFEHEGEAEERMLFINNLAEEGMFNIDSVVIAACFDPLDPTGIVKQLMED
jgi:hypothetical protein